MTPTLTDLWVVALTIMGEAEGEPYEGKVAVAAVIYNRARQPGWWGKTITDACWTSKQFSAWNDDSIRRGKMGEWDMHNAKFADCLRAAVEAWHRDPTNGATHYYAPAAFDGGAPFWAEDGTVTAELEGHIFMTMEEET